MSDNLIILDCKAQVIWLVLSKGSLKCWEINVLKKVSHEKAGE